jgi:hypothetical protein
MSAGFMNFKVIFIALMVVYIRTSCKLYLIKKIRFCNLFIPKTEPIFFKSIHCSRINVEVFF